MELEEAITKRRSIRRFRAQTVPKETLERIIQTAIWAPSAMNTQPWHFTVLAGEKKDALVSIASESFEKLQIRLRQLFPEKHVEFLRRYFMTFGNAPVIIAVAVDKLGEEVYRLAGIQSAAAAIQNLLLLAHAEGLGACWMTGVLWVRDQIESFLNIPSDQELAALVAIGYPEKLPSAPLRKHMDIIWVGF